MRNEQGNILVVVLAGFLILAIEAAAYFLWQNQQLQKTPSNQYSTNTNQVNFPTPPSKDETTDWRTFTASKYEIKYPADWKSQITPLEGERLIQIGPNYPASNYPGLYTSFSPLSATPLDAVEQSYANLGLKKSSVNISGNEYIKYSGTLPTKTVNGQIISSPIQSTHLLKEKNGDLYELGYSYEGSTTNASLEKTFGQILSTFQIINDSQISDDWEVFSGNSVKDTSFSPYTIKYPATWTKSIEYFEPGNSDGYYSLVISKNGYSLRIAQAAFGVERCIFSDETTPQDSPYADLRNKKYTEFSGQLGRIRRYLSDSKQAGKSVIEMCIQQPKNSAFVSSSNAGSIQYWVPDNPDARLKFQKVCYYMVV